MWTPSLISVDPISYSLREIWNRATTTFVTIVASQSILRQIRGETWSVNCGEQSTLHLIVWSNNCWRCGRVDDSMVGHCSHCCSIMNTRVDVNDLEVNSRIRVGDSDVGTVKYIGEVITNPISFTLIHSTWRR